MMPTDKATEQRVAFSVTVNSARAIQVHMGAGAEQLGAASVSVMLAGVAAGCSRQFGWSILGMGRSVADLCVRMEAARREVGRCE